MKLVLTFQKAVIQDKKLLPGFIIWVKQRDDCSLLNLILKYKLEIVFTAHPLRLQKQEGIVIKGAEL
jgi:hypothetical protein